MAIQSDVLVVMAAYNDRILLGEVAGVLLGAQRSVGPDTG
jgi:hypothetical protein